ncbi:hypothetical protein [Rubritalea squalenifaciens]|nr:hypothetical protein [Rubritalea squalenifaciens]
MPDLIIQRDSGYADSLRAYKLILDGAEIGTIKGGESRSYHVDPGKHTIQAKIDWCSSPPEEFVADHEPIAFEVFSKVRGFKFLGAVFAAFNPQGWIGMRKVDATLGDTIPTQIKGEQGAAPNH